MFGYGNIFGILINDPQVNASEEKFLVQLKEDDLKTIFSPRYDRSSIQVSYFSMVVC